jgi:hypothetical protein
MITNHFGSTATFEMPWSSYNRFWKIFQTIFSLDLICDVFSRSWRIISISVYVHSFAAQKALRYLKMQPSMFLTNSDSLWATATAQLPFLLMFHLVKSPSSSIRKAEILDYCATQFQIKLARSRPWIESLSTLYFHKRRSTRFSSRPWFFQRHASHLALRIAGSLSRICSEFGFMREDHE